MLIKQKSYVLSPSSAGDMKTETPSEFIDNEELSERDVEVHPKGKVEASGRNAKTQKDVDGKVNETR